MHRIIHTHTQIYAYTHNYSKSHYAYFKTHINTNTSAQIYAKVEIFTQNSVMMNVLTFVFRLPVEEWGEDGTDADNKTALKKIIKD